MKCLFTAIEAITKAGLIEGGGKREDCTSIGNMFTVKAYKRRGI